MGKSRTKPANSEDVRKNFGGFTAAGDGDFNQTAQLHRPNRWPDASKSTCGLNKNESAQQINMKNTVKSGTEPASKNGSKKNNEQAEAQNNAPQPANKTDVVQQSTSITITSKGRQEAQPLLFDFDEEGKPRIVLPTTIVLDDNRFTLTELQREEFQKAEENIEKGLADFIAVGRELRKIQQNKLYREKYGTFVKYCQEKWNTSRTHAYRLMYASDVASKMSRKGDKITLEQASALKGTPEEKREEILKEATTINNGDSPSAKQIKEVAAEKGDIKASNKKQAGKKSEQKGKVAEIAAVPEIQKDNAQMIPFPADTQEQLIPLTTIQDWILQVSEALKRMNDPDENFKKLEQAHKALTPYVEKQTQERIAA